MVKTVTSINGRLVDSKQACISVFDNSLLYAEGLFETFLSIDNNIVFEKEHLRRLMKGIKVTGLDIPASEKQLHNWAQKTLKAHPARINKLRLTLTSGESARWTGRKGKPQVIFSAAPHKMPQKPFKLHVSRFKVDHASVFRRIKTISYAIHAAALKQSHNRGCDDSLLLNQRGNVAEVTTANIYWVKRGRVYTPPLEAGCLDGVTRLVTLREAKKVGHPITERRCPIDKLHEADEIFISSSLKLILPVGLIIHGRRRHRFEPGPVCKAFSDHMNDLAGLR